MSMFSVGTCEEFLLRHVLARHLAVWLKEGSRLEMRYLGRVAGHSERFSSRTRVGLHDAAGTMVLSKAWRPVSHWNAHNADDLRLTGILADVPHIQLLPARTRHRGECCRNAASASYIEGRHDVLLGTDASSKEWPLPRTLGERECFAK